MVGAGAPLSVATEDEAAAAVLDPLTMTTVMCGTTGAAAAGKARVCVLAGAGVAVLAGCEGGAGAWASVCSICQVYLQRVK
jgi:hypothetical protein